MFVFIGCGRSVLAPLIQPYYLEGIIVAKDPAAESLQCQQNALKRTFIDRCEKLKNQLENDTRNALNHNITSFPELCIVSNSGSIFSLAKSIKVARKSGITSIFTPLRNTEMETPALVIPSTTLHGGAPSEGNVEAAVKMEGSVKKKKENVCKPCGSNMNWIADVVNISKVSHTGGAKQMGKQGIRDRLVYEKGGSTEVTLSLTGLLQGATNTQKKSHKKRKHNLSSELTPTSATSDVKEHAKSDDCDVASIVVDQGGIGYGAASDKVEDCDVCVPECLTMSTSSRLCLCQITTLLAHVILLLPASYAQCLLNQSRTEVCDEKESMAIVTATADGDHSNSQTIHGDKILRIHSYNSWKRLNMSYRSRRKHFLTCSPFNEWITDEPTKNPRMLHLYL